MWMKLTLGVLTLSMIFALLGCGDDGDSSKGSSDTGENPDLAVMIRIDDTTGFLSVLDGSSVTELTNANGTELYSGTAIYGYNGYIYTGGSMDNDNIAKYEVQDDNSLKRVAQTNVYESGGSIPTSFTFVNETKAYLPLAGIGQLIVINPTDLSITKRIDLSAYAMDTNGETGGSDTNPEPGDGVIRDGKFYLGLAQIDSFGTYACAGKASVLIIDVETDEILKHITDDRTCATGVLSPNPGFALDENGDIYLNNTASWGYGAGLSAGFLRIKNGEDEFDPDYFFSINDLTLDVPGGVSSYAYTSLYMGNGQLYTTLFIPGLTSDSPDYVNDRNYAPYVLDLYNQTATKLDMPATAGWATYLINYNGEVVYGMSTSDATGLYKAGATEPFITTEGSPYILTAF